MTITITAGDESRHFALDSLYSVSADDLGNVEFTFVNTSSKAPHRVWKLAYVPHRYVAIFLALNSLTTLTLPDSEWVL